MAGFGVNVHEVLSVQCIVRGQCATSIQHNGQLATWQVSLQVEDTKDGSCKRTVTEVSACAAPIRREAKFFLRTNYRSPGTNSQSKSHVIEKVQWFLYSLSGWKSHFKAMSLCQNRIISLRTMIVLFCRFFHFLGLELGEWGRGDTRVCS